MKLRDLFFCMFVAMIICSCGKQQNDLTWQEASGNVKSIRTTGYEATEKFGEIREGDVLYDTDLNTLMKFNNNGFITEITNYNRSGNISQKSVCIFDEDGKLTKINKYDEYGDEIQRTVYTYNENKKVTKIVDYDKSGKIICTNKYELEGDKVTKHQFISEYSKGNYDMNEYKGNTLVKSVEYDKNGKPTGEYKEFENEKIKKIVQKDYTVIFTYNDKGLCTSVDNGQLISTNSYSVEKGESYTYDYEYDDKGNWVRKIERKKDSQIATRIFVREIEYFSK